jgi:hypothetical protein
MACIRTWSKIEIWLMMMNLSSTKENALLKEERMRAANSVPKPEASSPQPSPPIAFEERIRAANLVSTQEPAPLTFPSAIKKTVSEEQQRIRPTNPTFQENLSPLPSLTATQQRSEALLPQSTIKQLKQKRSKILKTRYIHGSTIKARRPARASDRPISARTRSSQLRSSVTSPK